MAMANADGGAVDHKTKILQEMEVFKSKNKWNFQKKSIIKFFLPEAELMKQQAKEVAAGAQAAPAVEKKKEEKPSMWGLLKSKSLSKSKDDLKSEGEEESKAQKSEDGDKDATEGEDSAEGGETDAKSDEAEAEPEPEPEIPLVPFEPTVIEMLEEWIRQQAVIESEKAPDGDKTIDVLVQRQKTFATEIQEIASKIDPSVAVVQHSHSIEETVFISGNDITDTSEGTEYKGDYYAESHLTGDAYVLERLTKHLIETQRNAATYSNYQVLFTIVINIIGASGTLLATMDQVAWVPLTVALVTGLATFNTENMYPDKADNNRTVSRKLDHIRATWGSLPAEVRSSQKAIDDMVAKTEAVLEVLLPNDPSGPSDDDKKEE